MTGKKKAITELKKGLEKFREDAMKDGWEKDEVDAKISEVFENFPWYKYDPPKKSWKSRIGKFFLYSFIVYLIFGAVMERNRRWKKRFDDYIFDTQLAYHSQRVMRILSLPIFKFYDLSQHHELECLINNPFRQEEEIDCTFCEGIESILKVKSQSKDLPDMIAEGEPVLLTDEPGYFDKKYTFMDFQTMFQGNEKELDEAICKIEKNEEYTKVSELFKNMDEESLVEKNISIEWSNCHTYGTRFYRKLFPRPSFIAKEAEIHFEKRVYMLQKEQNSTIPSLEGKNYYLYQVQGQSEFELLAASDCSYNCTTEPITTQLGAGDIVVFPNGGWLSSFKVLGDGLNVLYLSSFT